MGSCHAREGSNRLAKVQPLHDFGKYGCDRSKICPVLAGLPLSPGCGASSSAPAGMSVAGSSVCSSVHLQFQWSPGLCWFQKGSSMGRVSFIFQKMRCSASGSADVVGIHRRLGMMSLLRSNCFQSAASCARLTAVLYSVRSHGPT